MFHHNSVPPYCFALRSGAYEAYDSSSSDTPGCLCWVRSLYRCAFWYLHLPGAHRLPFALFASLFHPFLPIDPLLVVLFNPAFYLNVVSIFVFLVFDVILLLTFILSFLPIQASVEDLPFTPSRLSTHTHYCPDRPNRLQHQLDHYILDPNRSDSSNYRLD